MNILESIFEKKKQEVSERKELYPIKLLEKSIYFNSPTVSLKKYLQRPDLSGIIAEFKRKSPSKGMINAYAPVERTTIGYMQAGSCALSVLTDQEFFGGKNEDLMTARKYNYCPILRKDFVIDEYQVLEAKSIGADAILLIAAMLNPSDIERLAKFAKESGLEVILEVYSVNELKSNNEYIDILGINNRDLRDFSVELKRSFEVITATPKGCTCISESGIDSSEDIGQLKKAGFQGFLIGERFMKHSRPEIACGEFIKSLK